jgi:serine/threonine protein kinase
LWNSAASDVFARSHYEILVTLGVGGMGVVYKARDTRLDRLAAIKILKNATADDDPDHDDRVLASWRTARRAVVSSRMIALSHE